MRSFKGIVLAMQPQMHVSSMSLTYVIDLKIAARSGA